MNRQLVWSSAARSHVGRVRRVNEDAYLEQPQLGAAGLWVVADGMGGHAAGDVASRMIVDELAGLSPPSVEVDFVDEVEQALQQVNQRLRDKAKRENQKRTMGSTVVALLAFGSRGWCLWAGDSRIYGLRNGQLKQLTRDHSHVQELVDRGLISATEARDHPLGNVITRAVGSQSGLQLDQRSFELAPGDIYLLCSDGLSKLLSDDEITEVLRGSNSPNAVRKLIDMALERGADDNVTAIVVSIHSQDDLDVMGNTIPLDGLSERLRQSRK